MQFSQWLSFFALPPDILSTNLISILIIVIIFHFFIFLLQQDYEEEGIPTRNFAFPDNRHILELFLSKNGGIIDTLEEESRDAKGNDTAFGGKMEFIGKKF